MNGEQKENRRGESEPQGGFSEDLVEEIDFDLFTEKKRGSDTEVSTDYRDAFAPRAKSGQRASKKGGRSTDKKPEERQIRAALEAAEQARTKAQKRSARRAAEVEEYAEKEQELDDFLPEGEAPQEDILLIKKEARGDESGAEDASVEPAVDSAASTDEKTTPPSVKRRGKRRYGIGVGALVMILALVGLTTIALGLGRQVYNTVTDDSRLRVYDTFLSPIVMQDPEPFASIEEASTEMIMEASLWRAVSQNGAQYNNYDDEGRTLIPLGDVVEACHQLFGPNTDLQPATPQEESFYEYDAEQNVFRVAPFSTQSSFAPYTVSTKRAGSQLILQVGYVIGMDEWQSDTESQPQAPEPIKYMEYVLETEADGSGYYVTSVRAPAQK